MQMIFDHTVESATIFAVYGLQIVTDFGYIYFCWNCGGWLRGLAFERRLRNLREQAYSFFVGWHNVEVFVVPTVLRLFLYILVPNW